MFELALLLLLAVAWILGARYAIRDYRNLPVSMMRRSLLLGYGFSWLLISGIEIWTLGWSAWWIGIAFGLLAFPILMPLGFHRVTRDFPVSEWARYERDWRHLRQGRFGWNWVKRRFSR